MFSERSRTTGVSWYTHVSSVRRPCQLGNLGFVRTACQAKCSSLTPISTKRNPHQCIGCLRLENVSLFADVPKNPHVSVPRTITRTRKGTGESSLCCAFGRLLLDIVSYATAAWLDVRRRSDDVVEVCVQTLVQLVCILVEVGVVKRGRQICFACYTKICSCET